MKFSFVVSLTTLSVCCGWMPIHQPPRIVKTNSDIHDKVASSSNIFSIAESGQNENIKVNTSSSKQILPNGFGNTILATCCLLSSLALLPSPALAAPPRKPPSEKVEYQSKLVGQAKYCGNWYYAAQTVNLRSFSDPKIDGLTLYLSYQQPQSMSLACQPSSKGGARLAKSVSSVDELKKFPSPNANNKKKYRKTKEGEKEVDNTPSSLVQNGDIIFKASAKMGGIFPTTREVTVQRFYDDENHNLIYMASSPRRYTIDGTYYTRTPNSICVVPLLLD